MAWILGLLFALAPAQGVAQEEEGADEEALYLSVAPESGRLDIRIGNLFADEALADALHSGLPLRILIVVDLWKDGFFDSHRGRGEWRATVVFDPLEASYRVDTGTGREPGTLVDSLSLVRAALQSRFTMPILPRERGRYYYLGRVEVETLSLSDLEELQRWLRGDLAPAVAGDEEVGGAVGRGVGRIFVRVLGLPARRFRVRTPKFEVEPPPPAPLEAEASHGGPDLPVLGSPG